MEKEVSSGTWRISNFVDSGVDETVNFSGYNFTFKDDGTLTASNGSSTFTGTWSVSDSNSQDDNLDDLHFNINFNLTNNFEDLNDDWDIVSHSSSKLELIDVSGGNGGTDLLTFVKN
ncbi:MAG: hypothetical protein EP305_12785 [Bacteroidetes bacterium]|nr:MAG: hypothetical protein EP305_12785 [Bacteroidota bacterium]